MNKDELINELEKVGLSDKEAQVYLASLRLGGSSIQDIAEASGVNRTTTHVIMRGLIEKGLASSFTTGKKQNFTAESPDVLKAVLAKREQNIMEIRKDLTKVLPDLRDIYTSSEKRPQVRFLEGREAIRTMDEDFLKTESNINLIKSFVPLDNLRDTMLPENDGTNIQRVKARLPVRVIYTHRDGIQEGINSKDMLREGRFIPRDKFPFSTEISLYSNKLHMTNYAEPISGVIIENAQIANSMRAIFDLAWEAAEKYNKK